MGTYTCKLYTRKPNLTRLIPFLECVCREAGFIWIGPVCHARRWSTAWIWTWCMEGRVHTSHPTPVCCSSCRSSGHWTQSKVCDSVSPLLSNFFMLTHVLGSVLFLPLAAVRSDGFRTILPRWRNLLPETLRTCYRWVQHYQRVRWCNNNVYSTSVPYLSLRVCFRHPTMLLSWHCYSDWQNGMHSQSYACILNQLSHTWNLQRSSLGVNFADSMILPVRHSQRRNFPKKRELEFEKRVGSRPRLQHPTCWQKCLIFRGSCQTPWRSRCPIYQQNQQLCCQRSRR